MLLHFTKMEGCGNDYIYVNGFTEKLPQERKPELVKKLSRLHFGIGGDGVIFINPSKKKCTTRTGREAACAGTEFAVSASMSMITE